MSQYIDILIPGVLGLFVLLAPRDALTKARGARGEQAVRRMRVVGVVLLSVAVMMAMREFGG